MYIPEQTASTLFTSSCTRYICIYIYIYIYVYAYRHIDIYTYMCTYIWPARFLPAHSPDIYVYMSICIYIYVCIYIEKYLVHELVFPAHAPGF